jgi:hypothetical protein
LERRWRRALCAAQPDRNGKNTPPAIGRQRPNTEPADHYARSAVILVTSSDIKHCHAKDASVVITEAS